jgi:hypothetical protein
MDNQEIRFPIKLEKSYDYNSNSGRWRLLAAVEIDGRIVVVDMGVGAEEKIDAARHLAPLFSMLSQHLANPQK